MDLQTNASKVVELDAKIKKLSEQFAALKVDLMQQMIADNVSEVVIKRKKVILCHRQNKDFGSEINRQELEIKAEKKKLETLGEFTISSVTNFIQVR
jgi:restriction endonuclease S subunit